MFSQKQREKIKKFFEAIDKVSHEPGDLYDLGLIISDTHKVEDLISLSPYPKRTEVFNLSSEVHPDNFLKALIQAFRNKKWLLVEIRDGYLPGRIYNQLRLLSLQNRLQIFNLGDEEEINYKMPPESRIVFLSSQESLSKINNPTFLKLFGPIIRI